MEINIRNILAQKSPRLAKFIPGFILNYLERIVHQKELNVFLKEHGHKIGVEFIHAGTSYFNVSNTVSGLENVPENGRYLFVSNHPLGGFDGVIIMAIIAEKYGDVKTMANDILMNLTNLEPMFLAVNKHGAQSKETVKLIDEAFESDVPIFSFPAGLCSRKIKGKVTDLEWKKNFITKAIQTKRDVVPIYFEGHNSEFFYRLSNIRKKLGIKVNIEMLYLIDELFKHRNGKFTVTFGKPISYSTFDKKNTHTGWANEVKKHVYQLKSDNNATFKG